MFKMESQKLLGRVDVEKVEQSRNGGGASDGGNSSSWLKVVVVVGGRLFGGMVGCSR